MNNIIKYPLVIRILHWLMAVIILSMIASGLVMSDLDKSSSLKPQLYSLHKSFGITILFLIIIRIIARLLLVIPPLPVTMGKLVKIAAGIAHFILYGLMLVIPITGYMMSNMFGHDVGWFGLKMPTLFQPNKEVGGLSHVLHTNLPYILLAILIVHVFVAIWHHYFDKSEHDVIRRIV